MLLERFKAFGDKVAFIDKDQRFTYRQILDNVSKFSTVLHETGIKPGETVIYVGDYSPNIYCFMLALMKNKSIAVPLTYDSVVERAQVGEISRAQWYVEFSSEHEIQKIERVQNMPPDGLLKDLIDQREPGIVLFSSGSTGKPKGMLHNFNKVMKKFEKQRTSCRAICFLMMDHFGGINTLLGLTANGGTVVTIGERTVKVVCEAIEKYSVELLPTTPSFLTLMVHTRLFEKFNLSSLKKITYGTEVMPEFTLAKLRQAFPHVELQQTYGLSELGVLQSKSRPDGSLWVKVGGSGFETQVREGILWIRSQYAMLGYLNAPNPFDSEGWFNTQDRVEVDGEYFKILGRVTDLINVAGQKVYPAEIENVILQMENIEDVAVYGESSPLIGNFVVAAVKTNQLEPLAELKKRIRATCSQTLASYKVPTKVVFATEALYSSRMKKRRVSPTL
jgi:acyl-CoA synthetase (AMP-forming)/AMP-acid ligase II